MKTSFWKTSGVTLVELMIGSGVFVVMMSMASISGYQLYIAKQKIERTNELYTESRFVLDRIIHEIRSNTIDYYEYFSHNMPINNAGLIAAGANEYGKHPGKYEMFFKYIPHYFETSGKHNVSDSNFSWQTIHREDDQNLGIFNTGADNDNSNNEENDSALGGSFIQEELYLLSSDGIKKTIIRLNIAAIDGIDHGVIEILKMQLVDSSSPADGQLDTWKAFPEFDDGAGGYKFISITPDNINITQLGLIISPLDDPYKSFAESIKDGSGGSTNGENPHIQPHVILKLSAKLSEARFGGLQGDNKEIEIQTAAASRVLSEVVFPRN